MLVLVLVFCFATLAVGAAAGVRPVIHRIRDIIRNQKVLSLPPEASVRAAARAMAERNVGSVLVMVRGKLVGIFTERDALVRVLAAGLDPDATPLGAVMVRTVQTIGPDRPLVNALHQMGDHGFRHMPVVEDGVPIGIVSLRDALGSDFVQLEKEQDFKRRLIEVM